MKVAMKVTIHYIFSNNNVSNNNVSNNNSND